MLVPHSCLPLSTVVKAAAGDKNYTSPLSSSIKFEELIGELSYNVRYGKHRELIHFDYRYENIFYTKVWKKSKLHHLKPKFQYEFLRTHTHWCMRLKENTRRILRNLLLSGKLLRLKEILNTSDGLVIGLLMGLPEQFTEGYQWSDKVHNSIISNCLFNYAKTIRDIKKFKKIVKSSAFKCEKIEISPFMIDHGWMVTIANILNRDHSSTSKERMFRIACLTQSRATGLGDGKMVDQTIEEFIQSVTIKREFRPSEILIDAIESVTSYVADRTNNRDLLFRTSMSTSSCIENGKKDEGKFGFFRSLVKQGDVEIDGLEYFMETNQIPLVGTDLWMMASQKISTDSETCNIVNVAGIRENGKVRIVTSGSFWKDIYLQPFSHLTIDAIKVLPELRNGLSAGRLGYRFLQQLSRDTDPNNDQDVWEFPRNNHNPDDRPTVVRLVQNNSKLYSSDWTDRKSVV